MNTLSVKNEFFFYFGSDDQHEAIIQDDPTLRKKFELAEKSLNLMQ